MILVILIFLTILYIIYEPYIDYFEDYRGEYHIILWYTNNKGERSYINIIGNQ